MHESRDTISISATGLTMRFGDLATEDD